MVDENIGVFTGFDDEIIITNDTNLNQIFLDFEVRVYNFHTLSTLNYYGLVCSCDATLLKQELDNYNSVISNTEFTHPVFLLSIENQNIKETKIYPNPFRNKVTIEGTVQTKKVLVYDILGKLVYKSNDTTNFENFSSSLNNGIYILKLTDQNDKSITRKLIKN